MTQKLQLNEFKLLTIYLLHNAQMSLSPVAKLSVNWPFIEKSRRNFTLVELEVVVVDR